MCTRPILRYHGGKWKLADWIIGNIPNHRIYVEPFGGAASVLLKKPRSYAVPVNQVFHILLLSWLQKRTTIYLPPQMGLLVLSRLKL